MKQQNDARALINAGLFLGIGMGGFIDGILFHQIFQIHNMLSNQYFPDTLANEQLNMFWDGLFHVFTWIMTAIGISLFWNATKDRNVTLLRNTFIGAQILGFGLFNLVEGIIDHHILEIHHVVERATGLTQLLWDYAFLASGIILIVFGVWLIQKDKMDVIEIQDDISSAA